MSVEIFPVVHINDTAQAVEQAGLAFEHDADGVFLIDHRHNHILALLDAYRAVCLAYPDGFVGVNALSAADSLTAFKQLYDANLAYLPDALWVDNADKMHAETRKMREYNDKAKRVRYLGGVAFKYTQFETDDPTQAAAEARRLAPYVDVVTTSGSATGVPPSPAKILAMKEAIGDKPLAIASGIDIDNIARFAGIFDQLLVATAVETEKGSGIFDEHKLKDLIQAAHDL